MRLYKFRRICRSSTSTWPKLKFKYKALKFESTALSSSTTNGISYMGYSCVESMERVRGSSSDHETRRRHDSSPIAHFLTLVLLLEHLNETRRDTQLPHTMVRLEDYFVLSQVSLLMLLLDPLRVASSPEMAPR